MSNSNTVKGQSYAVGSGLLASLASLCGKFAMAPLEAQDLCENIVELVKESSVSEDSKICSNYVVLIRIVSFGLMFLVNCLMWTTFTKALRFSQTSLEATITNTAANFFFTATVGQVLFGEKVTGLWWTGTVLIIIGLLLMHYARNPPPHKPGTKKKFL